MKTQSLHIHIGLSFAPYLLKSSTPSIRFMTCKQEKNAYKIASGTKSLEWDVIRTLQIEVDHHICDRQYHQFFKCKKSNKNPLRIFAFSYS